MIAKRLQELGLELPPTPKPLATYTPAKRHGGLVYISGQLPLKDGKLLLTGPIEPGADLELARRAMEACLLGGLAAASLVCKPEEIKGILKLGAYVASTPQFTEHHLVANGASDLAIKLFGDAGVHTRFAVGVAALPLNSAVELEIIFEL